MFTDKCLLFFVQKENFFLITEKNALKFASFFFCQINFRLCSNTISAVLKLLKLLKCFGIAVEKEKRIKNCKLNNI